MTGYPKQIQLTPADDHSTESLNPSCSLTVQLAIGSLVLPDQRVCAPVSLTLRSSFQWIQNSMIGLRYAWQVIVQFYEFCWVHEALTNIIRLIQQLPDWESA